MQNPIQNRDLRGLFVGAAGVAVVGLLAGAAMQPQLKVAAGPDGPQIMAGMSGARTLSYGDPGAAFTGYQGAVPDYVLGTDWTKTPPAVFPDVHFDPPAPDEASIYRDEPYAEPVQIARWEEPAREPVRFPSESGGVPYGADLPAPPSPPAPEADPDLAEMAAATPG